MTTPSIVIVASIVARYDAISLAVRDTYFGLKACGFEKVTIFTGRCDFDDMNAVVVNDVAQLLMAPKFLHTDLILYQFGIYSPLFDALLVGNGHAKQVVIYQNITPAHLVAESSRAVIERSYKQLYNLRCADQLWPASPYNAYCLRDEGFDPLKIDVIPLVVQKPEIRSLEAKPARPLRVLFVGRAVVSKGLTDALECFARLREAIADARFVIACNTSQSDPAYMGVCRRFIDENDLAEAVTIDESPTDAELCELFLAAHVLLLPTHHEGFCVPVVEALRAGAIPVGYDAGNMKFVCEGLGRLVPTGEVDLLAQRLIEVARDLKDAYLEASSHRIRLDRGAMLLAEFGLAAAQSAEKYQFERVSLMIGNRVARLLNFQARSPADALRDEIRVLPDCEMRERDRPSLNRIPDISDWEAGGKLSDVMRELNQPICIHRKSWEYAMCIQGLRQLGGIRDDAVALAVGAGSEPPLYYFANAIRRMVATDLYDNEVCEGTPAMLASPRSFAPFPYNENRLEVYRMSGDDLQFPDATFDFTFSLSSIEHFGSRETQKKALDEIARTLKPGGIACLITELILTKGTDAEYFTLEEIDEMFIRHPKFKLVGGPLDLSISASLVDYPVDLVNSGFTNKSPHIVLKRGEMKWTSLSLFLQRIV
jgi:glycosyltransferase involved in cell wall biosynthesis/SAM-dependent methyltransferase